MRITRVKYTDAQADARIALHAAVADAHHTPFNAADARAALEGYVGEGHIAIPLMSPQSVGQGTWGFTLASDRPFGFYLQNTSNADGDNVTFNVWLDKGTYTLLLVCDKSLGAPILDIDVDAVEIATFDLYADPLQKGQILLDTGNVITTSGLKALRLRVDGKNPSSGDYQANLNAVVLWRTA